MKTKIIFEDEDIIVVHKPVGIATQTAKIGQIDVESELRNYRKQKGEDNYIGMIHRLDQPVEGLLVFAKNKQAAKKLSAELASGELKKGYHALVVDTVGSEGQLVDYLLKNSATNSSKVVSKDTKGAKRAELTWKYEETCNKNNQSYQLVKIEIATGRHHQIRVQMSHAKMPLLGDTKYGDENSCRISESLEIRDTALLASNLSFIHPRTNRRMEYHISFPQEWCIKETI